MRYVMTKKILRYVFIAVIILAAIWAAMAVTDYLRCRSLKEPVNELFTRSKQPRRRPRLFRL